ncbi:hypothetical protein OO014_16740 [Intrasporangium calvum]|uniref:Uncharacterized protein n=1 Tax=Intrasporangium calvum TaxID=53358 RepID=A0ABT5GL37_9MICO|nr:hypothetical protein [Intrasporangium calvum]MDC5698901.1 hypothetical protein [Intrasporangium calvum]
MTTAKGKVLGGASVVGEAGAAVEAGEDAADVPEVAADVDEAGGVVVGGPLPVQAATSITRAPNAAHRRLPDRLTRLAYA